MCRSPVRYHEIAELPGIKMFRCDRLRASLTVASCVSRWGKANRKPFPASFELCRTCPTGADHAGFSMASTVPYRRAKLCARCRRDGVRMVRQHLCVSCANREYEYLKGRNGRGTVPVRHPELGRYALHYRSGTKAAVAVRERVTGFGELMLAVLRDDPKHAAFAFHPVGVRATAGKGDL